MGLTKTVFAPEETLCLSSSMLLVLDEYRSRTTSPQALWATQTARIGIQQTRQGLLLPFCVMQAALSHLY